MHEDQKLMGDLFFDQLELSFLEEQLLLQMQKKAIAGRQKVRSYKKR
ncbi:hypothetical protein N9520_02150 [Amylibacter sp.]|nr:hypothetical protein [Amylibacter sp.]